MSRNLGDLAADALFTGSLTVFCLTQVLVYFSLPRIVPKMFATVKQKGWILTALNSLVSTFASIPFWLSWQFGLTLPQQQFQEWRTASTLFCSFFMSYLLADLVLGTLFYPSQMGRMTGYFHHCLYLVLIPFAMTIGIDTNFVPLCVMELPTLLMSVAQIKKSLRNDMLFGGSYFVTRIVLHSLAIHQFYIGYPETWLVLLPAGIFPLHIMWFRQWCVQQIRLSKRRKETRRETEPLLLAHLKHAEDGLLQRSFPNEAFPMDLEIRRGAHGDTPAVYLGKERNNAGRLRVLSKKITVSMKN